MLKSERVLYVSICSALICICSFSLSEGGEFCQTAEDFATNNEPLVGSPCKNGECDSALIRMEHDPDFQTRTKIVRLFFHVLRNDDGSNPALPDPSYLDSQMVILNQTFSPYALNFTYDWRYVDSTLFRVITGKGGSDNNSMKTAFALAPDSQLNIFVTDVDPAKGTFPWDTASPPLSNLGGIVIGPDSGFWPNQVNVLAHEVGHCLGLWHSYHGVSGEVEACGPCFENIGSNGEEVGDLCEDTPPIPRSFLCTGNSVFFDCNNVTYSGPNDNIMSVVPDVCRTEITLQQAGRMHCWIMSTLSSWRVAETITVPGDYLTIQEAIARSSNDDTIVVSAGTHAGSFSFGGKKVTVMSADGPATTIIDLNGSLFGVTIDANEGPGAKLMGFTIANGSSAFSSGALYIDRSSPVIENCIFTSNQGLNGGAVTVYGGENLDGVFSSSEPVFVGCTFDNNSATGLGGAIHLDIDSRALFSSCIFSNNSSGQQGGAVYVDSFTLSGTEINNCLFSGNNSAKGGGAIHVSGELYAWCNTLVNNTSSASINPAVVTVIGTLANVLVDRFNIVSNSSPGVYCDGAGTVGFVCNNFWSNTGGAFSTGSACDSLALDSTNIFVDPQFCDASAGDYTLEWTSPLEDVNNSCLSSIGAFGATCGPAPFLSTPLDNDTTNNPAPVFDWTDVSQFGGLTLTYEILIDDDPTFSSPDRSAAGLNVSQWTIQSVLANGDWFWRSRAVNQLDATRIVEGDWSVARLLTTIPSLSAPSSLFVEDYTDFTERTRLLWPDENIFDTGWVVERKPSSGSVWTTVTSLPVSQLDSVEWFDSGTDGSQSYDYRVYPIGVETVANVYSPTATVLTAPHTPRNLSTTVTTISGSCFGGFGPLGFGGATQQSSPGGGEEDPSPFTAGTDQIIVHWESPLNQNESISHYLLQRTDLSEASTTVFDSLIGSAYAVCGNALNRNYSFSMWAVDASGDTSMVTSLVNDSTGCLTFCTPGNSAKLAVENGVALPAVTELVGNYPNPFNPETSISFSLAQAGHVRISVYNILGQQVAVLIDGQAEAGESRLIWDGRDESGSSVSSGVYFYRLEAEGLSQSRKMLLLK